MTPATYLNPGPLRCSIYLLAARTRAIPRPRHVHFSRLVRPPHPLLLAHKARPKCSVSALWPSLVPASDSLHNSFPLQGSCHFPPHLWSLGRRPHPPHNALYLNYELFLLQAQQESVLGTLTAVPHCLTLHSSATLAESRPITDTMDDGLASAAACMLSPRSLTRRRPSSNLRVGVGAAPMGSGGSVRRRHARVARPAASSLPTPKYIQQPVR